MRGVRLTFAVVVGLVSVAAVAGSLAVAAKRPAPPRFAASLGGYQQVPSISTTGRGTFTARLARNGRSLAWTLKYRRMESRVREAHIHFAQPHVNGGVIAFLCSNLDQSTTPAKACPRRRGTVRGTIRAADVLGPADQGIEPGHFRELVRAMRAGATYVNVHTQRWPAGEIRGQVRLRRR